MPNVCIPEVIWCGAFSEAGHRRHWTVLLHHRQRWRIYSVSVGLGQNWSGRQQVAHNSPPPSIVFTWNGLLLLSLNESENKSQLFCSICITYWNDFNGLTWTQVNKSRKVHDIAIWLCARCCAGDVYIYIDGWCQAKRRTTFVWPWIIMKMWSGQPSQQTLQHTICFNGQYGSSSTARIRFRIVVARVSITSARITQYQRVNAFMRVLKDKSTPIPNVY